MILWGSIILVVLASLPVLIGFLLPERYQASTVVELDRSIELVWAALQNYEAHPMTGKMMKSVEALPSSQELPAWQEDMGRGEIITVTTTTQEPPRSMIREMSSATVHMTSRWTYTLEPAGEGTRISLSGVTDIRRGTWHTPIFRFMMVVGGGVRKGLDLQLDMVASTLGTEAHRVG